MKVEWFWGVICCPKCRQPLCHDGEISCVACGFSDTSGKDLRIHESCDRILSLSSVPRGDPMDRLASIDTTAPRLTYHGPRATRDSVELMSEIAYRLPDGGAALDMGCGPRDQAVCLKHLGFLYVGVDYANGAADFLADAHSLPLRDSSFDCVFSYAVLEHLHNPFLAVQEVRRVLKPGGWFIGTVSQGEPFHNSYFHCTPWALISLVDSTPELKIERMWGADDTLFSLASMGRYPKIVKLGLAWLGFVSRKCPWLTPRKMYWPIKDKELDRLFRAGGICFAIQKRATTTEAVS